MKSSNVGRTVVIEAHSLGRGRPETLATSLLQARIVSDLRTSDQAAEISDDDIEGEVDPRVVHAGTTASPVGSRPGGNHPAGG
jgi:hypothetical protein